MSEGSGPIAIVGIRFYDERIGVWLRGCWAHAWTGRVLGGVFAWEGSFGQRIDPTRGTTGFHDDNIRVVSRKDAREVFHSGR